MHRFFLCGCSLFLRMLLSFHVPTIMKPGIHTIVPVTVHTFCEPLVSTPTALLFVQNEQRAVLKLNFLTFVIARYHETSRHHRHALWCLRLAGMGACMRDFRDDFSSLERMF